jgi:RNA polymerase sigma-70 factor (ECF subfamily)
MLQDLAGTVPIDPQHSRSELADAMAGLSPAHCQAMLLRFVDELSIDEIAAATGVPSGTVKSRLHHAIAALRADPRMKRFFDLE